MRKSIVIFLCLVATAASAETYHRVDRDSTIKGRTTFRRDITMADQADACWREDSANGVNKTCWRSAANMAADVNYTWPDADGSSGQCMQTDGAAVTSWGACDGATVITGSGTANHVTYFTGAQTVSGDTNFQWDPASTLLAITGTATISGDLTVNTDDLVVDTANGRVGINVASPSSSLDINDGVSAGAFRFNVPTLMIGSNLDGYEMSVVGGDPASADPGAIIRLCGSTRTDTDKDAIIFRQGGTELGRFATNGFFAAGDLKQTSPLYRASIISTSSSNFIGTLGISNRGTTVGTASGILFNADDTGVYKGGIAFTSDDTAYGRGKFDILVNEAGTVGHATLADSVATFDGALITFPVTLRLSSILSCGSSSALQTNASGDIACGTIASEITGSGAATQMTYWTSASNVAGDAGLTYDAANDALTVVGDLTVDTDTLYVDSANGRVGIGTAAPTVNYLLDVVNPSGGGNRGLRIFNATGTAGSSAEIQIKSGFAAERMTTLRMNIGTGPFDIGGALDTSLVNHYTTGNHADIHFGTQGVINFTVESGGEIGIGVTSPTSILDVDAGASKGIITIDGAGGACLKLRDTDEATGGGFTYCTTLNGVMTCGTGAC